jgi:putative FmdB family regulatory protein
MPIYEYTCGSCKNKFEHLARSMSSEAKVKCPECGSPETARSLSVFAVSSAGPKGGGASDAPTCGRCGGAPGSCATG